MELEGGFQSFLKFGWYNAQKEQKSEIWEESKNDEQEGEAFEFIRFQASYLVILFFRLFLWDIEGFYYFVNNPIMEWL